MRRESRLILAPDGKDAAPALRIEKECRGIVDAVKVGWPLTLAAGPQVVTRLAAAGHVVLDFKIAANPPTAARGAAGGWRAGWPLARAGGPQVVPRLAAEAHVICDFKIADIPPIAATIAASAFALGAKGVICHGFAGEDSVRAIVEAARGDVFVLAEMSHPGGQTFTAPVAEEIARLAVRAGATGIIAPATRPERGRRVGGGVGGRRLPRPRGGGPGG